MTDDEARESLGNVNSELLLGMVDAMFALGIALTNAGLVSRDDLAKTYARTADQMRIRASQGDLGPFPDARAYAVQALAQGFAMPVRTGFQAIEGGKE